jgi:formyltetrahydrofolate hydrolase
LWLRCADRPGLVSAVSTFLAEAGANIVSLDQRSTAQSGRTFLQRTIFHLPGLTVARDSLERDTTAQLAARFDMDFRLTEAANPNGSRSWPPRTTTASVKVVGATAHYVTEDLDDGPIIEQDAVRVDHRPGVNDLVRLGAVLSRAVPWHCEDRIIRNGNQTIVSEQLVLLSKRRSIRCQARSGAGCSPRTPGMRIHGRPAGNADNPRVSRHKNDEQRGDLSS